MLHFIHRVFAYNPYLIYNMHMKYKNLSLFILPCAVISSSLFLSSCGEKETTGPGMTYLDYGYFSNTKYTYITELDELTYEGLAQKVEYKESFALALYTPGGCGCWDAFNDILAQYLNKTNIKVSYMSTTSFPKDQSKFGLVIDSTKMPAICIFQNGKLVIECKKYDADERIFNRLDFFENFMNKYTYSPVMYKIEEETLESLVSNDTEFNVMFSRYTCPDCNNLKNEVIQPWLKPFKGQNNKKLYVFDDQKLDSANRTRIKDNYGVSNVNNPTLGYNTGYVPTIQHRKGSTILDMITVNNDSLRDKSKGDSTFFTKERLPYLTFLKDDTTIEHKTLDEGFDDMYSTAEYRKTYHNPISRLFLKTYCE